MLPIIPISMQLSKLKLLIFFLTSGFLVLVSVSSVHAQSLTLSQLNQYIKEPTINVPGSVDPEITAEIENQVNQFIIAGHQVPVIRWYTTRGSYPIMREPEFVLSLSQSIPYITNTTLKVNLKTYLKNEVINYLLEPEAYAYCCLSADKEIKHPNKVCIDANLCTSWQRTDPNYLGSALYALWAYGFYTGDWSTITDKWSLIKGNDLYGSLKSNYNTSVGLILTEDWKLLGGQLNLNAHIGGMIAARRIAEHALDTATRDEADNILVGLMNSRIRWGKYSVTNPCTPVLPTDLSAGGCFVPDIRQVYFANVNTVDMSVMSVGKNGFGYWIEPLGYRPLYPELGRFMKDYLFQETTNYFNWWNNHNPWWHLADSGYQTESPNIREGEWSTENLFDTCVVSFNLFQMKSQIIGDNYINLKQILPWRCLDAKPGFRDMFRLQNLTTLASYSTGTFPTPTPTVILCTRKGEGDANCDGVINILDFETWRREFLGIDTTTKADFDSSGGVTILDFEIWRRGFLGQ